MKVASQLNTILKSKAFDVSSFTWLLYFLSCHDCCDQHILTDTIVQWSLSQFNHQIFEEKRVTTIIPLVRLFANLSAASPPFALRVLNQSNFAQIAHDLLNSPYEPICKETFLWIANILNQHDSNIQAMLESSKIPGLLNASLNNVAGLFDKLN